MGTTLNLKEVQNSLRKVGEDLALNNPWPYMPFDHFQQAQQSTIKAFAITVITAAVTTIVLFVIVGCLLCKYSSLKNLALASSIPVSQASPLAEMDFSQEKSLSDHILQYLGKIDQELYVIIFLSILLIIGLVTLLVRNWGKVVLRCQALRYLCIAHPPIECTFLYLKLKTQNTSLFINIMQLEGLVDDIDLQVSTGSMVGMIIRDSICGLTSSLQITYTDIQVNMGRLPITLPNGLNISVLTKCKLQHILSSTHCIQFWGMEKSTQQWVKIGPAINGGLHSSQPVQSTNRWATFTRKSPTRPASQPQIPTTSHVSRLVQHQSEAIYQTLMQSNSSEDN